MISHIALHPQTQQTTRRSDPQRFTIAPDRPHTVVRQAIRRRVIRKGRTVEERWGWGLDGGRVELVREREGER